MPPSPETAAPRGPRAVPWADLALVGAAAVLVYLNALPNGFALDDGPIIVDNATVHHLSDQARIWLTPYWPGAEGLERGLYRPLTILAFAVQWAAGEGQPWIFHAVGVGLHAASSMLVLGLLRLFLGRIPALFGAAVFAVHPLHVEAVANGVGQAELLAALFVLVASVAWGSRPRGLQPSPLRMLVVLSSYLLAMLTKEHAVVLPGLLLALDAAQGRVREAGYPSRVLGPALALGSGAAVYLVLRWIVLGGSLSGQAPVQLDFLQDPPTRILVALSVWPEYLRLLVAPFRLSFTYDPGVLPLPTGVDVRVLAGGLLLGLTLSAIVVRRAWPGIGLGASWFLLSVLPISNLILPIGTVLAERTLYLPSVSLAFWTGYGVAAIADVQERRPVAGRVALAIAALWTLALATKTVSRNPVWADNAALVARGLETHPGSFQVQWFHALELWETGDMVSSERSFAGALDTYDGDARFLTHYARFRYETGDVAGADTLIASALRIHPGGADALYVSGLVAVARGDAAAARERMRALQARGFDGLSQGIADSLAIRLPPGG